MTIPLRPRPALALLALCALPACAPRDAGGDSRADLRIVAISTRPHLVTGGDVLLRIEAAEGVDLSGLEVEVNGTDASARFRPAGEGGAVVGLVDGLRLGENEVHARAAGADGEATLQLVNYPISGPIISGPHEQPFVCQTESFELAAGGTLGRPVDANCSAPTRVDYVYLSTKDGEFRPYAPASPPADVARATTLDERTVPFIVRVQTGTVNRAIYESAILHDPADPAPDPWTRSRGWNGKLVYTHGGGCRNGWYQQGRVTGGVLVRGLLEMGYATTSSSLNVFGQNCNDLLASETHIMVKERFVESYGEPVYTISIGSSGGAYQSHQTADNYPGVFDGIIVSSSFPDVASATIFTLADARLLYHYFTVLAPEKFTKEQQRLVSGFGAWGSLPNLSAGAARLDPTHDPAAPPELQGGELALPELVARRYRPAQNPPGLRATVYDHSVNVYGVDEATGFAARPLDNRGVQYGLDVLNRGLITTEQFLALNRDVGGFDADLNHVRARHRANPEAARRAFASGRILHGGGGLASTPVIDYRDYRDHLPGGDIHMKVHQFATRARMVKANGHADNHVMTVGGKWGYTEDSPDLRNLFLQMDRWLMGVRADASADDLARKVVRARPADLVDNCWDDTAAGGRVEVREPASYDGPGQCNELFPSYPTPRQVAGATLTNDIVACQLEPVDPRDYRVTFAADELRQLREIFPDGVCDWSRGDAHSRGYQGTWLSFGPSPVNRVR